MGDEVHEDIRESALRFFDAKLEQKASKERADAAKEGLIEVMREYGLRRYHDAEAEILVEIEDKENVKVLREKGADESPVTAPGPDAPISEKTLNTKKPKPNAGVPRAED